MIFSKRPYSLRKCKQKLVSSYRQYRRKSKHLSVSVKEQFLEAFEKLQIALEEKNSLDSEKWTERLEYLSQQHLRKTFFESTKDLIVALALALFVAVIVRQMWFEPYEIPSGSMRPTLREKDKLLVSKTQFGINIPLTTKHLGFDPNHVEREGIVVFTGANMDISDVNTMYFYLFPGKKQYIKRLIGKPGDTLYFYGGKIYGIDKDGQDISSILDPTYLENIDHVPFLSFEGRVTATANPKLGMYSQVVFKQMNIPVAELNSYHSDRVIGRMLPTGFPTQDYGDLWGIKNYAMVRLVKKEDLSKEELATLTDASYYLEMTHDPTFKGAKVYKDMYGRMRPHLRLFTSHIPLDDAHLQNLYKALYTARFVVKDGKARAFDYTNSEGHYTPYPLPLSGIPDGTYEFYNGEPVQIGWQGIQKSLPTSHPLYHLSLENLYALFNGGMELDARFLPSKSVLGPMPSRFAYYRNGDLFVMGKKLFSAEEESLTKFTSQEQTKASTSSTFMPYYPFIDHKPPMLADGSLDKEFIKQFGVKIPEKNYLVLGDNYARSADSRDFGFVPQSNIRGVPEYIFWPPGNRMGKPLQAHYATWTVPRITIWVLFVITMFVWWYNHRKKESYPPRRKNSL